MGIHCSLGVEQSLQKLAEYSLALCSASCVSHRRHATYSLSWVITLYKNYEQIASSEKFA